jgi:hypothetical protein
MKLAFGLIALAVSAPVAAAIPVPVISYSMPNGNGTASGGGWNYWDLNYTGTGSTTTDGAPLSGGVGDLTDGYIAPGTYNGLENGAGTGPYVGWFQPATTNPVITFNFAGNPTITDIALHVDNTSSGGVFAPVAIWINGINTPFTAPTLGTVGFINFTGLSLTGNSLSLQLDQGQGRWVFVSEISFSSAVPEAATWAMLIAGFGMVGATLRRRRMVAA